MAASAFGKNKIKINERNEWSCHSLRVWLETEARRCRAESLHSADASVRDLPLATPSFDSGPPIRIV